MSTWIERCEQGTGGPRIAVKDLIDVAGLPTTGGCRAVAQRAEPATADAACLAGLRDAVERGEARMIGKANLDELGATCAGVNPWFGDVVNPLAPDRVAGGSSGGSAAAVAAGETEIGIGTDTGGSIRIPAACCGITGLKTTHGRVSTEGMLSLSQSLDVIGPIARDVAGTLAGMRLLEPGFEPAPAPAARIGRVRLPDVDPAIDRAIDSALRESEIEIVEIELPGWEAATQASVAVALSEAIRNHGPTIGREPENVGPLATEMLLHGRELSAGEGAARRQQWRWIAELELAFNRVDLLATPTLAAFPPPIAEAKRTFEIVRTTEVNLAGVPALAQPVRTDGPVPAGLQLIGPRRSEPLLLTTGALIESAAGAVV